MSETMPAVRPEANTALKVARAFVVDSNEKYLAADANQFALQSLEKLIVGDFAGPKQKAAEAHKAICYQEKGHLAPVQEARRLYKGKMYDWQQTQERLRQEKERELQEKSRKLAEEHALAEAEMAEAAGDKSAADAIISAPMEVPTVIVAKAVPKTATVLRKIHKWRVKDSMKINRAFLTTDEPKIGQVVRSMGKDAEAIVGGIEVFQQGV